MYQKSTCVTCKKEKEYLTKAKISFDEMDIVKNPPSRDFLEEHIDPNNLDAFINKHSKPYKELKLANRKIDKSELIDLMLKDPNLIKRPVMIDGKKVYFGYTEL
jgi:arsenate reductase